MKWRKMTWLGLAMFVAWISLVTTGLESWVALTVGVGVVATLETARIMKKKGL